MTPEQIRAEYVETAASALHASRTRAAVKEFGRSSLGEWPDKVAPLVRSVITADATAVVDALAEAGLLPTGVRWSIAWRQVPESTPESGGQTKVMAPRPHIGTSEAAE